MLHIHDWGPGLSRPRLFLALVLGAAIGSDARGPQFLARERRARPKRGGAGLTQFRVSAPRPLAGNKGASGRGCQEPEAPVLLES